MQGDEAEIAKLTERMKAVLGPFVLRRLKTEVAGALHPAACFGLPTPPCPSLGRPPGKAMAHCKYLDKLVQSSV